MYTQKSVEPREWLQTVDIGSFLGCGRVFFPESSGARICGYRNLYMFSSQQNETIATITRRGKDVDRLEPSSGERALPDTVSAGPSQEAFNST